MVNNQHTNFYTLDQMNIINQQRRHPQHYRRHRCHKSYAEVPNLWDNNKLLAKNHLCHSENQLLIPQVRPAHKYPNSPWEMIHTPGGDNAVCMEPYTVYTAGCNKSLTATYQCKTQIPSNKLLANNILNNNE
jgi:hypothetical protein